MSQTHRMKQTIKDYHIKNKNTLSNVFNKIFETFFFRSSFYAFQMPIFVTFHNISDEVFGRNVFA